MAKPGIMNLSEDEINFGKYLLAEKNELFVKKTKTRTIKNWMYFKSTWESDRSSRK